MKRQRRWRVGRWRGLAYERERERERRVRWKYVWVEILKWRCFEKGKKFLSALGFNLYYRFVRWQLCSIALCRSIHNVIILPNIARIPSGTWIFYFIFSIIYHQEDASKKFISELLEQERPLQGKNVQCDVFLQKEK